MANTNFTTKQKIQEKLEVTSLISSLATQVENEKSSVRKEYRDTGELKQSKNWRTDELLWEDEEHTIPKMEHVYAYVDKSDEELTEDDKIKLSACDYVLEQLLKLI